MAKTTNKESSDSLSSYFHKVNKIKILSPEEEKDLVNKAKDGDLKSFKKIIIANQKLVVKEALKYYFKEDNFLDLINEGNKGLIEALKRFDINRGNRFYTYALWWVRSEIRRYLSKNQNIISFPDIFYNDYLNFKKVLYKLTKNLKRRPTEEELSEFLNIPLKKVKVMLAVPNEIVSLDNQISGEQSSNLSTIIKDNSAVDPLDILTEETLRKTLEKEINELTEKESMVIKMRFGFKKEDPMRLREIAKKLDMSPEGIRRIEARALLKLKKLLYKQGVYGVLN
ncbi:MAG: RNA polymerase sigma factor RpoD/SigA [Acidobacteriota bacterium]